MKTSRQILNMSTRGLRRLVARLQTEVSESDVQWSRGGDPATWPLVDAELVNAKQVKRAVYQATKEPK